MPPKPALTAEQRSSIVSAATQGMAVSRDKMESITFYSAKDDPWVDTGITVYISVPDMAPPIFRIDPHYHGDSWIFFKHVKVMADSVIVYDKEFASSDMKHDNNSAGVYENVDYPATYADIDAVRKIAAAKTVTVRLSGDDKREDVDLDAESLARMARVLKAYDEMSTLQ